MAYVLYRVDCARTGKSYIGYTSKTAQIRFAEHKNNARWGRKTALYAAIRAYGPDAFSVVELLVCESHKDACEHERRLIAEAKTVAPGGYNLTFGGDGVPLTDEQRAAASAKKVGKFTAAQREAADRRIGSKASPETRAKLSAAKKGRKQRPEHVARRVEAFMRNKGKQVSPAGWPPKPRARGPRIWTPELRERERQRAAAQWTPQARAEAKARASKQWDDAAREKARQRKLEFYREKRAGGVA